MIRSFSDGSNWRSSSRSPGTAIVACRRHRMRCHVRGQAIGELAIERACGRLVEERGGVATREGGMSGQGEPGMRGETEGVVRDAGHERFGRDATLGGVQ